MRTRTSPFLLLAVWLVGCQPPADEVVVEETMPAVNLSAEAEAVEAVSMKWEQAAKARDLDAVMTVFSENAVTYPDDQPPAVGVAAIRTEIRKGWNEAPDAAIDWETTSVHVAEAGDMAWERGTWTFDPDGAGEAEAVEGEYLTIYEKVGGDWKVVADMGSETSGDDGEDAM
jgi:ketosteroid isomerase-like protein